MPLLTMALNIALIATIFVTRKRWDAWAVEKVIRAAGPCERMIVTGDGRSVVTIASGLWFQAWDIETGRNLATRGFGSLADVSPDRTLAILRHTVHGRSRPMGGRPWKWARPLFALVELETGRERFCLEAEGNRAHEATFTSDGTKRRAPSRGPGSSYAHEATFTSDGGEIVTCHADGAVRVWNVEKGEARVSPKGAELPSLNRTWPVEGSRDGTCRTTDPDGTARTVKLEGAAGERLAGYETLAQPLPDGRRLAGWNAAIGARVWDARTGEVLSDLRASGPCRPAGDAILVYSKDDVELRVLRRVRPERWWGVLWLPHFWVTAALAVALAASAWRDLRRLRRAT